MGDMMSWVDMSLLYEEVETEEQLKTWVEKANRYGMSYDLQLQFVREKWGKIMANMFSFEVKIPEPTTHMHCDLIKDMLGNLTETDKKAIVKSYRDKDIIVVDEPKSVFDIQRWVTLAIRDGVSFEDRLAYVQKFMNEDGTLKSKEVKDDTKGGYPGYPAEHLVTIKAPTPNTPNKNGIIYPSDLLQEATERYINLNDLDMTLIGSADDMTRQINEIFQQENDKVVEEKKYLEVKKTLNTLFGPLMKADPSKPWYPTTSPSGGVAGQSNIANSPNKNVQRAGQVIWNPQPQTLMLMYCLAQFYSKDAISKIVPYFFVGMKEGKRVWSKNWQDSMTFTSQLMAEKYAIANFPSDLASKVKAYVYQ